MKEELIRILNTKLEDINSDIDSLVELNGKIANEEADLSYITGILDLFEGNNVMNFPKLSKDDFNKVLDILDGSVKEVFSSPSCNYDGLVYLINGINDGVSLTLTDEQKNGILYLIEKLNDKKSEHETAIEGFNAEKSSYVISDVDELKAKKENYLSVLDEINNKEYVSNIDLIQEAIKFSGTSEETTIDILKYLLEYNAEVYKEGKDVTKVVEEKPHTYEEDVKEETFEEPELPPFGTLAEEPISFESYSEPVDTPIPESEFHFNDVVKDDFTNFSLPIYNDNEEEEESSSSDVDYEPHFEETEEESNGYAEETSEEEEEVSPSDEEVSEVAEVSEVEEVPFSNEEKVSTNDLHQLLGKYDIQEDNTYINELVVGDIKNYEEVLNILEENKLIDSFKNNSRLLVEALLYSNSDAIKRVLEIIKNDLSVDADDYAITTKIAIDTIPSIFIVQDGNFNNFVENVRVFKELDLNLINLFDFSKEVFVADNETITNNLAIVEKYGFRITYQNAKYLLLLSNIGDRLDYYVESVYRDSEKNETFDGIEYINEYAVKLNTVTDETIKRLRYCSENGKKIFGSKPKSLTGDITNLKVNTLDITGDYLSKFFNNEFAILTGDEVREYVKLVHNSSNVGNYEDELDILDKYRSGLRYVIEGINVSYNKVIRNYSILRSYGIDTKKALHFAVCYNLVITKDEYDKLKNILDELGGER